MMMRTMRMLVMLMRMMMIRGMRMRRAAERWFDDDCGCGWGPWWEIIGNWLESPKW